MKKFLSNTIVQLLIAVIIGLSAGFVVNDAVLEAIDRACHCLGKIGRNIKVIGHFPKNGT